MRGIPVLANLAPDIGTGGLVPLADLAQSVKTVRNLLRQQRRADKALRQIKPTGQTIEPTIAEIPDL